MNNPDREVRTQSQWRTNLGKLCIWIVAVAFAIGFGGNVFQMVVVDPVWSASPPGSLQNYFGDSKGYDALRRFHINPFFSLAQVCLVAALILNWRDHALRRWLLPAVTIQVAVIVGTLLYVYPINDVLMVHAARDVSASTAAELTRHWLIADRLRLFLKFLVFISVLGALQRSGALRQKSTDSFPHATNTSWPRS